MKDELLNSLEHYGLNPPDIIFQQDNDPKCSSSISALQLEKSMKESKRACDCRTTLLVRRQVTHTCESQWRIPERMSFMQGPEEEFTVCTRGGRQEDKLDCKSNYPRVYIHFGSTT